MAALSDYCHRAVNILDNRDYLQNEINTIKQIAINKYKPHTIDRMMNKITIQEDIKPDTINTETNKYCRIGKFTNKILKLP